MSYQISLSSIYMYLSILLSDLLHHKYGKDGLKFFEIMCTFELLIIFTSDSRKINTSIEKIKTDLLSTFEGMFN